MFRDKFALFKLSRDYWILAAFLALLGLTAGSGRDDIQSLIIIRPMAVLLCFYGLWGLTRAKWAEHRASLIWLGAIFVLVLTYLIPLPPSLWQLSPGHKLIADIDQAAGFGDIWRSYSIAPNRTINALFALAIPAAVLLLMIRIDREERWLLLFPLIWIGIASVALALLQAAAPSAKALWFYRLTNDAIPVGLFANRNHAAIFHASLLPMLAVLVQMPTRSEIWTRIRVGVVVMIGLAALAAVFASASRAGLVCAILAVVSLPLLLRDMPARTRNRKAKAEPQQFAKFLNLRSRWAVVGASLLLALTMGALIFSSDAPSGAGQRLTEKNESELRWGMWQRSLDVANEYAPFGSGPGTFVEAYKIGEPIDTLGPNYINHAHNDLIETALTTGVGGLLFLTVALAVLARSGWRMWKHQTSRATWKQNQARMAWIILVIFVLASAVDYPLRVPSLLAVAVVMAYWATTRPNQNPAR